mmetsp:Transcript_52714/g.113861  ORF Transcript_52714/g.113861 Transcript_52714/m.113861 type:complete len:369 (-) Transcript_52714:37-1143(-)
MCCSAIDMGVQVTRKSGFSSRFFGNQDQRRIAVLSVCVCLALLLCTFFPGQEPELLLGIIGATVFAIQEYIRTDLWFGSKSSKALDENELEPTAKKAKAKSANRPRRQQRPSQSAAATAAPSRPFDQPWRQRCQPSGASTEAKPSDQPWRNQCHAARKQEAASTLQGVPADHPWRQLRAQLLQEQRRLALLTIGVTVAVVLSALFPGQEPELLLALIAGTVYAVQELRWRRAAESDQLSNAPKVVHISQARTRQIKRQSSPSPNLEAGLSSEKSDRQSRPARTPSPKAAQPKPTRAYDQPWRQQSAPQISSPSEAKPSHQSLRSARSASPTEQKVVKPSGLPLRPHHPQQKASPRTSMPVCMTSRVRA